MRASPRRLVVLVALVVVAPVWSQGALKGGWHEDTRNGYKIKIPDKWEGVPIAVDEKWIVAKYLGDRALVPKRTELGYAEMKPQLRVIVFSDEARKFKPAELKVTENTDERVLSEYKAAQIPYKDYKDYIKRNGQDGGFHFSNEKEAKVGGMPCWQYEIKFEKLTVPRRVIAWVFRGDAADYAVEFEVLEDHWDKYSPAFTAALQSFKFIKRDASTVGATGGTTGSSRPDVGDSTDDKKRTAWKALSAKERAERRKSTEESQFRRVKDNLPPGWTVQMTPYFLVVSHADQKFTDKVVENIAACRGWLDKTFGGLNDEYVMRGVIRICANADEARAYLKGSDDSWNPDSREIIAYKSNNGSRLGFDQVYVGMLNQYLFDKDPLIRSFAPRWITFGLNAAVSAAVADGRTLKLQPDEWESTMIRESKGARMTARQIMEAPAEKFFSDYLGSIYAARLVRYLHATKKDFLLNYLKAVASVGDEMNKAFGDERKGTKEATTEEEEEAQAKSRRETAKKHEADLVKKVHAQVCNWSEKEWQAVESGFSASLK